MLKFNKTKGRRTRMNRVAIEEHWDDFSKRFESAIVSTQLVTRAKADGTEHRYIRRSAI